MPLWVNFTCGDDIIINGLKVVGKQKEACKVVVNGAGSAGVAITKLLLTYGFTNIVMCDTTGSISKNREKLNWMKVNLKSVLAEQKPPKSLELVTVNLKGKERFC